MHLNQEQLKQLEGYAIKAALAAGKIISSYMGQSIKVNSKDGGENIASCVVTEVDLKAQEVILIELKETFSTYELGLLTEEKQDDHSRFEKDYFWCIDPLDGTLAFSRNQNGFSVSIALVSKEGESVLGVVYNPKTQNIYSASKGNGSFKNNQPFNITKNETVLTVLYDHSYKNHPNYSDHLKIIEKNLKSISLESLLENPLGGAVMNAIMTIESAPAIYFKLPKKAKGGGSLWDFAATSIIQREAGGLNTDINGNPLELNKKETTFMNDDGVIYASESSLVKVLSGIIPN